MGKSYREGWGRVFGGVNSNSAKDAARSSHEPRPGGPMTAYRALTVHYQGRVYELHRDASVYIKTRRGVRKVDADEAREVRKHFIEVLIERGDGQ